MTNQTNKHTETFEYKAEMKQLLNIIINSLYTHPEVFLRELISNASDALNKVRFLELTDQSIIDAGTPLQIRISLDEKTQVFSIFDNGIGMTKEELVNNIGTIARSGTREFIKQLKETGKDSKEQMIGQFGVGFYSIFMVTDEVTIETCHALKDSQGYVWKSQGSGTFSIDEKALSFRGTKISFRFKESAKQFNSKETIESIIKKYSNFVDFPIYVADKQINTLTALWQKPSSEIKENELNEFYKFLTNDFDTPLGHVALSLEGSVNFKALLFIPENAPLDLLQIRHQKSIHLYSNKVLIQDDCKNLLPEYLQFVKGVVDTSDLPLNVSREITQSSPVMTKIKNVLVKKVFSLLEQWAEKEQEKYKKFYANFGPLFKSGISMDFENKNRITELLRFTSTKTEKDEMTSLKKYVETMPSEQKEIYYLSGADLNTIKNSPNLEYFNKNNVEVLLIHEPIDIFIMPGLVEYDKKPIKSIEKSDLEIMKDKESKIEKPTDALTKSLLLIFKETLRDKIVDVIESKRLVNSPVTLVVDKDGIDPQMEQMMKMMDKNFTSGKRILEINLTHPVISNLSKVALADPKNALLKQCILQLYEGALLLENKLTSPIDYVKRMTEIMQEATK